jgi:DNA-binding MarR family transcriptional regulator
LVLAEQLFDAISLVRRQTRRLAGRPWPVENLSGSQVELVRLVRRRPDVSVAEAATDLSLAANTVSTLIRQLVDAGLLQRTVDENDHRIARLRLTAAAAQRVEKWRDQRAALMAAAISEMTAADRAALERALPVVAELASKLNAGE